MAAAIDESDGFLIDLVREMWIIGRQLEVVQSQVCRTQDEVLATGETWKAALLEKGWSQDLTSAS